MSTSTCSRIQVSDILAIFFQNGALLSTWPVMYKLRQETCLFAAGFCDTKDIDDGVEAGVLAAINSRDCLTDDKSLVYGLGAWRACACCRRAPCLGAMYIALDCIQDTLGIAAAV